MNKTDKALYIVFFLTTCVCISWVYPQTIAQLEATDYFVWNDDYLRMKIAELPGITALLSDYLLQFFRWQGVGMTIEATVLTLTALLLADTPRRMVFSSYPALGLALPLASLFMALFLPRRTLYDRSFPDAMDDDGNGHPNHCHRLDHTRKRIHQPSDISPQTSSIILHPRDSLCLV